MYDWLSPEQVESIIPTLEREDVSKIARSQRGFIPAYLHYKRSDIMEKIIVPNELVTWSQKRELFIRRTLPAYKKNPTYRRYLSLLAWAFEPKILHL